MTEFETSFSYACPKFLSPVAPNYDTMGANMHKVTKELSLAAVMQDKLWTCHFALKLGVQLKQE